MTRNQTLEQLARDLLHIDTLETRNSDSLDFHEVAVWQVRKALEAAYRAGQTSPNRFGEAGRNAMPNPLKPVS